jgi:ribosomal protein S18 acetylase RimI-like enzyme
LNESIIIREYSIEDKLAVLAILRLNTPAYFSPDEEVSFIDFLGQKIELYYVVLIKDVIIGAGGINFNEKQTNGFISWGMIHPDYQRQSIGSALLKYRIEKLQEINSIEHIIVRTSQMVYRFYEKNGFTLKNIVKDYWAKGFDLYHMIYQNE